MTNETGPAGDREVLRRASTEKGTPVETETKTEARLDDCGPGHVTLVAPGEQGSVVLNMEDLQAIVQAAYDKLGMLAEPSIEVEREQYEARQAEEEDMHLRSFADAWGRSVHGDRSW